MKWLIPPVFVFLSLVVMGALTLFTPVTALIPFPYNYVGIPLALTGFGIAARGSRHFSRVKTNINTFKTPDMLVTDGLFRYSRNPMYLGFFLLLFGAAIAFNALYGLALPLAFFLAAQFWYIPFEEKRMKMTFGAAYDVYRQRTRRWI
jgi:protein-S-isoprenylcysteine O-methyltransferase Ste14